MLVMSALQLRDYQIDLVDRLRASYRTGYRAPVLQLATGGGKTLIYCEVARLAHAKGTAIRAMSYREVIGARLTEPELWAYAQYRGYKPGWVFYRLRDQLVEASQ
jgi:hypothetical protein